MGKLNPKTALVAADNPVLWTVAEPVAPDEMDQAVITAKNMYTVMLAKGGAGLAAPQVNIGKAFFILKTDKNFEIFINPVIIEKSKNEKTDWEGCLSKPGFRITVRRPIWVIVRYFNGKETVEKKYKNMNSRVIQHEIDHLNGVVIWANTKDLRSKYN